MRRRDHANACIHLAGRLGSPEARARLSGHLVVERASDLGGWAGQNFAGARVELAPGTTVFALDVQKLYQLAPSGWVESSGPPATPELAPPPAPRGARPSPRAPRPAPPPGARTRPLDVRDGIAALRVLMGGR